MASLTGQGCSTSSFLSFCEEQQVLPVFGKTEACCSQYWGPVLQGTEKALVPRAHLPIGAIARVTESLPAITR